jgi:nucleoside-diphosphate-sugar epimerase
VNPSRAAAPVRSSLLLTGASGFVGQRVLRLLTQSSHPEVRLLLRDPSPFGTPGALPPGWRTVRGTLERPEDWAAQLDGVDTVVHLAAATGKVRRKAQFDVTLEGTRRLLQLARDAGARRFLFVSSIAVCYRDRPHYHYAEAKAAAEAEVSRAGLDGLIVRPTLVLGPGSPLLASLRRLALLPIPLLFGKGTQPVQPIHVDDLAALLLAALQLSHWGGQVIPAGGPERLSVADLMQRIRAAARRDQRRFLHLPLGPTRALLAALEPLLFPVLPFTAGQLAFFANPTVAEPNSLPAQLPVPALGIGAMLGEPAS